MNIHQLTRLILAATVAVISYHNHAQAQQTTAPAVAEMQSTQPATMQTPVATPEQTTATVTAAVAATSTSEMASGTTPSMASATKATAPSTATAPPTSPEAQDEPTSITLPDGLIYQVLRPGTGAQADTTSTRLVHYTLYLTNGKKLESSRDKQLPVPFSFTPGASEAIIGMQQGTNDMRIGEIRKLYVPAALAYGEKAHGTVPANSDLIFNVELVDLKKPDPRNNEGPIPGAAEPGAAESDVDVDAATAVGKP